VTALQNAGLTRNTFVQAIGRVLAIQQGLQAMQSQGHDTASWLQEQQASATIVIDENPRPPVLPDAPVVQSQSPLATPSASEVQVESPTPTPGTVAETSPPNPWGLKTAPDFTLPRVNGDQLTLSEQLTHGPVVLVFFQRCG
jgi:hypothetical protein